MADGKKSRILHIEDDRNIQLLVKAVLERAGLEVFSAFDAMQGLMMVRSVAPDVVVLDVMMPAGGGASVHERIRALNSSFSIPILIYSAADPAEIAKRIPVDPLTLILQKPAPPAEIVATVRKLIAAKPS
jgi:DNA-binding response OmpR family regulator